jgi:hypothetical protein
MANLFSRNGLPVPVDNSGGNGPMSNNTGISLVFFNVDVVDYFYA